MSRRRQHSGIRLTPAQQREVLHAQECDRRAATMPAPEVADADEIATLAVLSLRWDAKRARTFLKVSREAAEAIVANPSLLTRQQRQEVAWLLTLGEGENPERVRLRAIADRLLATLPPQ